MMFRTRKYAGTTLSAWPVIRGMCLLSFVYKTAKTVSIFSSSSLFTRKFCCDNGCLFVGRHICYISKGVSFMQTIRIIPRIPYQPFLSLNAPCHCFEQVIIFNNASKCSVEWKNRSLLRSLRWSSRSLFRKQ